MSYATNGHDGARIYFEDEGGAGVPVLLHDGFGDSIEDLRESQLAGALPAAEFRLIYVDHRGHGHSDKPQDPSAYAMPLRVADAIAVLDRLDIKRAHSIGRSWGGRLCLGIGEHVPERVRSLAIGGNQPYGWPDSPLTRLVGEALAAGRGPRAGQHGASAAGLRGVLAGRVSGSPGGAPARQRSACPRRRVDGGHARGRDL